MAVTKRVRYEVLRRDGHRCRYCGLVAAETELTVDHVLPVALGGSDHPTNLVAACPDCNGGKTSSSPDGPLVADVAVDAWRWSAAIRKSAGEAAEKREERKELADQFTKCWERWRYDDGQSAYRPPNWVQSIIGWLDGGLTMPDLMELAEVALTNPKVTENWRYFAGCCWRMVRERQERALEILAEGAPDRRNPGGFSPVTGDLGVALLRVVTDYGPIWRETGDFLAFFDELRAGQAA